MVMEKDINQNNEQSEQKETIIHEPNVGHVKQSTSKKRGLIISGVLIVVLVLGTAGYVLMGKNSNKPKESAKSDEASESSKVSADGLVDGYPLECVPRGHDNYRTNNTLAVDPTDANTVYVGVEYKGVYKSTDGGTTWAQSDKGIRGYPMQADKSKKCVQELGRTVIDPKDNKHILITRVESPGDLNTLFSENAGVWESKDAGATWTQMVKDGMNASGSRAIVFDPKDSNTIYHGTNNMKPSFSGDNGQKIDKYFNKDGILYQTKDSGQSWKELPTGATPGLRALNVGVDNSDSNKIWLFSFTASEQGGTEPEDKQKAVMTSVDGGKTWTSLADKLPAGYRTLLDGALSPNNGQIALAISQTREGNPKSFVTANAGASWSETSMYVEVADFDPNDTTGKRILGYAPYGSVPMVAESRDGGKTWSQLSKVPAEVDGEQNGVRTSGFAFSQTDKNVVYMSGSGGYVWKSGDGGKTWQMVMNLDKIGGANKNAQGSTKSSEQDQ